MTVLYCHCLLKYVEPQFAECIVSRSLLPEGTRSTALSERILAKVFILLCIDFNIPLCEVIFSFVAMAMLEEEKKNGSNRWY